METDEHGFGKRARSRFPLGSNGMVRQLGHRRGHQVRGQPLGEGGADRRLVDRRVVTGHHVRVQTRRAVGSVVDGDDGLGDAGQVGERRLHLTELDAEPVDLDLVVAATDELDLAVAGPARQVARAVEPLAVSPNGSATNRAAVVPPWPW